MSNFDNPLSNVRIASPCSADWDEMYGDERKRFCGDCKLNVYNLSGMTKSDAENLLLNSEGRLCVRFYRRSDGSIITNDCPVGWARVKQRTKMYATAAFSLLMALFSGVLIVSLFSKRDTITLGKIISPLVKPTPPIRPTMGAVAYRPENSNANANSNSGADQKPTMGNIAVPFNRNSKPANKQRS